MLLSKAKHGGSALVETPPFLRSLPSLSFCTMRRPTSLVVDTTLDDTTSSTTSSPDASTTKFPVSADSSAHKVGNVPRSPQYSPPSPPEPSIRLLFSLISRRHFFILVLPALLSSIFAGGIAPFMTLVVGQVFDALSKFPVDPSRRTPSIAEVQLTPVAGLMRQARDSFHGTAIMTTTNKSSSVLGKRKARSAPAIEPSLAAAADDDATPNASAKRFKGTPNGRTAIPTSYDEMGEADKMLLKWKAVSLRSSLISFDVAKI